MNKKNNNKIFDWLMIAFSDKKSVVKYSCLPSTQISCTKITKAAQKSKILTLHFFLFLKFLIYEWLLFIELNL